MLIFTFFILITIKAVTTSIDYWKDVDDELADESARKKSVRPAASLSRTVRTGRPSSVRVTPIKRCSCDSLCFSQPSVPFKG